MCELYTIQLKGGLLTPKQQLGQVLRGICPWLVPEVGLGNAVPLLVSSSPQASSGLCAFCSLNDFRVRSQASPKPTSFHTIPDWGLALSLGWGRARGMQGIAGTLLPLHCRGCVSEHCPVADVKMVLPCFRRGLCHWAGDKLGGW